MTREGGGAWLWDDVSGYSFLYNAGDDQWREHQYRQALQALLMEKLAPLLSKQQFLTSYRSRTRRMDLRLEISESQERIIEYIDYRPMGWWTLSQTATEEVRRRLRNWWRRPLQARVWNWKQRLVRFERRHFGRPLGKER